jgi:Lamin Tail Domain
VSVLALLGLVVFAQQLYFSPHARAASATIVISEVDADTPAAGTDTANEWFELQNVSAGSITLADWTIIDNVSSDTIPTITIGPGGHVIVAATAAGFAAEHPGFTGTVLTIADGAIGNGLANGGDLLILRDSTGVSVDGLSWGTNTTVLNLRPGSTVHRVRISAARPERTQIRQPIGYAALRVPTATPTSRRQRQIQPALVQRSQPPCWQAIRH